MTRRCPVAAAAAAAAVVSAGGVDIDLEGPGACRRLRSRLVLGTNLWRIRLGRGSLATLAGSFAFTAVNGIVDVNHRGTGAGCRSA